MLILKLLFMTFAMARAISKSYKMPHWKWKQSSHKYYMQTIQANRNSEASICQMAFKIIKCPANNNKKCHRKHYRGEREREKRMRVLSCVEKNVKLLKSFCCVPSSWYCMLSMAWMSTVISLFASLFIVLAVLHSGTFSVLCVRMFSVVYIHSLYSIAWMCVRLYGGSTLSVMKLRPDECVYAFILSFDGIARSSFTF